MAMFIWLIIRFFGLFFQSEQYFSLTTNQPTVFFSRLISTAERLLYGQMNEPSGARMRVGLRSRLVRENFWVWLP
jgi:hypothetical protein